MSVPPESIEVGKYYLTQARHVRHVPPIFKVGWRQALYG